MIDPYLLLRNAIVEQAIKDLEDGYTEVEVFFRGEWCQRLLDMDNMQLSGDDIIKAIKERIAERKRQARERYLDSIYAKSDWDDR